jgi:hypothetical protein
MGRNDKDEEKSSEQLRAEAEKAAAAGKSDNDLESEAFKLGYAARDHMPHNARESSPNQGGRGR